MKHMFSYSCYSFVDFIFLIKKSEQNSYVGEKMKMVFSFIIRIMFCSFKGEIMNFFYINVWRNCLMIIFQIVIIVT